MASGSDPDLPPGSSDAATSPKNRASATQAAPSASATWPSLQARQVWPSAHKVEAPMVLRQLRFSGIFEAVQIRQSGYPFRRTYDIFFKRYRMLIRPDHGELKNKRGSHGKDFDYDYKKGTLAI